MPKKLCDMQPSEKRRAALRVAGRVAVAWVVFIGAYFIFPIGHDSTAWTVVKLLADIALIGGVIWWQLSHIVRAEVPELRAVQAMGGILIIFVVLFASLYLSMSHNAQASFTQPLDHMGALYFTVTVFSTVGFGDITAKTDAARAVVTCQMILDLVLIGAVARLLVTAARTGLSRPASQS